MLSLLYGPAFTPVHNYPKNCSFDYMDLCWQSDVSAFKYAVYICHSFSPRSKLLLISWLQSLSTVTFGDQENEVCHCFHFFPAGLLGRLTALSPSILQGPTAYPGIQTHSNGCANTLLKIQAGEKSLLFHRRHWANSTQRPSLSSLNGICTIIL